MLFNLNINLSENDYLSFNNFHSFESAHGKKKVQKTRNIFILAMAVLISLVVLLQGLTTPSCICVALLLLYTVHRLVTLKKALARGLAVHIRRLKEVGKLPFDPISTLEFHEDKMVEITALQHTEQSYSIIERICIVQDRFILLYKSSVTAYILPMAQVSTQVSQEAFIKFLCSKCSNIEYY